jgi:hypothetical protein
MPLDGPEAGRPAVLEAAARKEHGDPQQYVPTIGIASLVLALCGEPDEARAKAEALRDRCGDPGVAEMVAGPWHWLITCVAVATRVTGLLDVIRSFDDAPSALALDLRRAAVDAGDALLAGDLAAAGKALERYDELMREFSFWFNAAQLTVYLAIATGLETVAAAPDWQGPLRSAREFATKARARWWLEQLRD